MANVLFEMYWFGKYMIGGGKWGAWKDPNWVGENHKEGGGVSEAIWCVEIRESFWERFEEEDMWFVNCAEWI